MTFELKEAKKKVIEDWKSTFPQLTLYGANKLLKIVGPITIGVTLIKLPFSQEYRPHFEVYPMWKLDIKSCFEYPIILMEYYNKKKLQFSIPYEKHSSYFDEVVKSIKDQSPLSFDGDVSLKQIYTMIDRYSKTSPLSASPNSYLQARLFQTKLEIALFISVSEAQMIFEELSKRKWNSDHFKAWKDDIGTWLKGLQETIENRDVFLKQIEVNKLDKKNAKLKSSTIIA